ncbi:MAG: phosphoribosylformylglycinamidine cyclo-ligase [Pyrobaculum sp.]
MRYKNAGVDLDRHRQVHKLAEGALGGARGLYVRWVEVGGVEVALHVDGVGTKTLWLLQQGQLETAGWDCVFVNINDVVCDGFKTVAAVDYIAVSPGLEDKAGEVLRGVSKALEIVGAALLGGEVAIMPEVVSGVDVVCTVLATREARPSEVSPGDYIIGLASTGPHANGYSLLRRLFRLDEKICGAPAWEVLLKPVADYSPVLRLYGEGLIKAAAHITGGSFTKLKRALGPHGADIRLGEKPCWALEAVRRGVPLEEAYRVFNMGVGMALFTDRPEDVVRRAGDFGLDARVIGVVKPGGAIKVDEVVFTS